MSIEPRMPHADWGSVLIQPDQKKMPVGDPTLWANTVVTDISATNTITFSDQIILAQAADRYSRSWSLSGILFLPQTFWNFSAGGDHAPESFPDSATAKSLTVWLSITQGIEKIQLEHQICLMAGGASPGTAPSYTPVNNWGLCNQQWAGVGGPYGAEFQDPYPPTEQSLQGRGFAAIGALIGNTISIRAIYARGAAPLLTANKSAKLSLLLTPYAPGAGI
jgi:hypothetical protein